MEHDRAYNSQDPVSPLGVRYALQTNDSNQETTDNTSDTELSDNKELLNTSFRYNVPDLPKKKKHFKSRSGYFEAKKVNQEQNDDLLRETYGKDKPQIFKGLAIYINGYTFPGRQQLHHMLVIHGGVFRHYMTAKGSVTHIIAENLPLKKRIEFAKYKVVKPDWIVQSIKKGVLLPWQDFALIDTIDYGQGKLNTAALTKPRTITDCNDPDFIQNFFQNSRLHHLSSWKMNLRKQFLDTFNPSMIPKRRTENVTLFHVDFDCFFATVSALFDKSVECDINKDPIAVCHGTKSSDIASCNYVARKYGIKNGMWVSQAQNLLPASVKLICLPYNFTKIQECSEVFYDTLRNLNIFNMVLPISIDEAICVLIRSPINNDLTNKEICVKVRTRIFENTGGCTVSVGCADSLILARLALKKAKPNGYYLVDEYVVDDEDIFWKNFSLNDIRGVGRNIQRKLQDKFPGFHNLSDYRVNAVTENTLRGVLGNKMGIKIFKALYGKDDEESEKIIYNPIDAFERKSLSIDINWGIRFQNITQVDDYIQRCVLYLIDKLSEISKKTSLITLKIMKRAQGQPIEPAKYLGMGMCDALSRNNKIGIPTDDSGIITSEVRSMFRSLSCPPHEVRGIAIHLTNFSDKVIKNQLKLPFQKLIPNLQSKNDEIINESISTTKELTPQKLITPQRQIIESPKSDNTRRQLFQGEVLHKAELSSKKKSPVIIPLIQKIEDGVDSKYSPSKEELDFLSNLPFTLQAEVAKDLIIQKKVEHRYVDKIRKKQSPRKNEDNSRDNSTIETYNSKNYHSIDLGPKMCGYSNNVTMGMMDPITFQGSSDIIQILDIFTDWVYDTLECDNYVNERDVFILENFLTSSIKAGLAHNAVSIVNRLENIIETYSIKRRSEIAAIHNEGIDRWERILVTRLVPIINRNTYKRNDL